ncbi:MAG: TIGR03960 family B12-binding radical SAM protein [Oceanidesulfovibrio sp.]
MRELLPLLPKPSRYLGIEEGAVVKNPDAVTGRMALAFPDLYEVGMSYTGMTILYETVNRAEHLWAERVFAPSRDAAPILKERGALLATLESDTPISELDCVGFHVTHELCYTNVLYMLDLAGIPRRAADRVHEPVILAGGGCVMNAEPLTAFMDCMVLGDGELILPALLEAVAAMRRGGLERGELLRRLAEMDGVYVPSIHGVHGSGPSSPATPRARRTLVRSLDGLGYPLSPVQPFGAVHDRFTIEIARGCTRGCRFCHAGMTYRPVRERSLEELGRIVAEGLAASGYEELSLLSLSTGDFSALGGLFHQTVPRCAAEQVAISLPSLRVGSVTPEIMAAIAGIRRTGATLAPEAGSQRLRDVINKGITEEQLLEHVRNLFLHGWNGVKLYFMIGLPTETDEDLDEIVRLCRKVKETAFRTTPHKKGRITITGSVSPFVPKPHTPFQWERQLGLDEVKERIAFLKERFRRAKINFRYHLPEMSWLEGVFSRGDRSLSHVVERAYEKGALFDSWNDFLDLAPWREAMAELSVDPERYLAARDPESPLPWDHINTGVSREFLLRERARALNARITPDCRYGACVSCGVCDCSVKGSVFAQAGESADIAHVLNQATWDQEPTASDSGPALADTAAEVMDAGAETEENADTTCDELGTKASHVRIWYAVRGEAAFLSQLELQPVFERAFRRAALPLSFSQGFHPLPLISFGRALPVGVASECEYINCFLREPLDAQAVRKALAPAMPAFLPVTRVEDLSMGKKQPQPVAERFRLDAWDPQDRETVRAAWERFREAGEFPVEYASKKGSKTKDFRLFAAEIGTGREDAAVRFTLDWSGGYMSPLRIAQGVCPALSLERFLLTKESSRF